MAFATQNPRTVNLGGGLRVFAGNWTGTVGDAPGSLTVQGAQVYVAEFRSLLSSDPYADRVPVSWAAGTASGTVTFTIPNNNTVAGGSYYIVTA
jgi:hypothetical protein